MSLADDVGHDAVKRWARATRPDLAALAIAHSSFWVVEIESLVLS